MTTKTVRAGAALRTPEGEDFEALLGDGRHAGVGRILPRGHARHDETARRMERGCEDRWYGPESGDAVTEGRLRRLGADEQEALEGECPGALAAVEWTAIDTESGETRS